MHISVWELAGFISAAVVNMLPTCISQGCPETQNQQDVCVYLSL